MKQPSTNARGNVERRESLFALDGTANCSAIMEISVKNSQEAKINVPYDPAILLIDICPGTRHYALHIFAQPCALFYSQ